MNETIKKALNWRYATKQFDAEKKVEKSLLAAIVEAGQMAPTAYGLQPFRLIHIKDKDIRKKIQEEAAFHQPQVVDASDFIVIAYRTDTDEQFIDDYINYISDVRGIDTSNLEGFSKSMKGDLLARPQEARDTWAGRQSYIALGMMLETAALLEVDACPMEGFIPSKVDEILNLESKNLKSVGFLALGYRKDTDALATAPKVRVSLKDLVLSI